MKEVKLPDITSHGVSGLVRGMFLPLKGASYILQHPKLWIFVIIPIIINFFILLVALSVGYSFFSGWLQGMIENGEQVPWYMTGLSIFVRILFWFLALILVYYIFTPLALIIAAPFNDILAESVEKRCGIAIEDDRPLHKQVPAEIVFALKSELKRLLFFGLVFVLLLLLNIIPILGGLLYIIAGFLWGCFGFAYEFTGISSDRRHLSLKKKMNLLHRNLSLSLGFGLGSLILLLIPFINVIAVSVCAVSGTILFCALYEEPPKNNEPH